MNRPALLASLAALAAFAATSPGAWGQRPPSPGASDAGRAAFEEGRYTDADRIGAQLAASGDRGTGLALRARALAAQGKVDAAIALLEPLRASSTLDGRRARIVLGELLIRAGRRADAAPVLLTFADDYNNDVITSHDAEGLAMVGRAMFLLRHPKDANEAFKDSVRADPRRLQTLLWWAELFFESDNPGNAEAEVKDALALAPKDPDALAMEARLKVEDGFDFDAAEKLVQQALATSPRHPAALAVRAGIALRDGDLDAANAAIDAGLAGTPGDLELLSLRAAARFLADDRPGFEAAKRAVFARDKEFARAYGIIGAFAEWEHRYDDLVAMMKEAVALDPDDGRAWAELGIWQTRAGDEAAGVASLREWWRHDHFNVRAYNTLDRLYEKWIPGDYESATAGIFEIRYPKAERAVLERYVPRMLGEAWGQMKVHYMFAPQVPVHVELYGAREVFSVRTSGLPNVGIQGVSFGHVVAAMSPASEPFNWGNVLWHELGHIFAIQLSKNHVPRWFTEGLSEYETMVRRPEWQRELDPELYAALRRGVLPGAVEMNRAFTHADSSLDVTVAYYAASQMVAFTAEQFGWAKITRALELWGEGKRTGEVLRQAFGVAPAEYDARFRAWAGVRLSRYDHQYVFALVPEELSAAQAKVAASPSSAEAHVALALALLHAHKIDEADAEIAAALKLDPVQKDAHYLAAQLAGMRKDAGAELAHLQAIRAAGGDGYAVQMGLAQLAVARKDAGAARAAFGAAHRFDPTQPDPVRGLFDLAVAEKRDDRVLAALRDLTRLDQHDRHAWEMYVTRLVEAKSWEEARAAGESGIYVDVENAAIHAGYGRALGALGDHEKAAFELESALLCDAKPAEQAQVHALLAHERLALGDAAGARAHRDEALKLDPGNADARGLKL